MPPRWFGRPYPTQGVKRAVWCTGRWLQSRNPGLVVDDEYLAGRLERYEYPEHEVAAAMTRLPGVDFPG